MQNTLILENLPIDSWIIRRNSILVEENMEDNIIKKKEDIKILSFEEDRKELDKEIRNGNHNNIFDYSIFNNIIKENNENWLLNTSQESNNLDKFKKNKMSLKTKKIKKFWLKKIVLPVIFKLYSKNFEYIDFSIKGSNKNDSEILNNI